MSTDFRAALLALAQDDPVRRVKVISLVDLGQLCALADMAMPDAAIAAARHGVQPSLLLKNLQSVDIPAQTRLLESSALVVGAGGLGGYVLELLARCGVGRILVADGDVFEESNLNRQLLSSVPNLGRNKALVAVERAAMINPLVRVVAVDCFLNRTNAPALIADVDVVVDALGGIGPRRAIHDAASSAGKPIVSAAVAGWTAVVGSERPGTTGISMMWNDPAARDAEQALGSLAPAACLCAAVQAAEVMHFLMHGTLRLDGRMLHADLETFSFELYDMS